MKVAAIICATILVLAGAGVALYAIGPGDDDMGWIAALLILIGWAIYPVYDDDDDGS